MAVVAVRFGDFELSEERVELRRGGEPVAVEPQVFDVLAYLVRHRDRVVPKTELLDQIWGDRFVSESALTSRIKSARRAIDDTGRDQRAIRTVHGRGYRFVLDVTGEGVADREVGDADAPPPGVRWPAWTEPTPRGCSGWSTTWPPVGGRPCASSAAPVPPAPSCCTVWPTRAGATVWWWACRRRPSPAPAPSPAWAVRSTR